MPNRLWYPRRVMPKDYKKGADRGYHSTPAANSSRQEALAAIRELEKVLPAPKEPKKPKTPIKRYWPV